MSSQIRVVQLFFESRFEHLNKIIIIIIKKNIDQVLALSFLIKPNSNLTLSVSTQLDYTPKNFE